MSSLKTPRKFQKNNFVVKVGFHPSFSRYGITRTSSVLLIWLNENVRFIHYKTTHIQLIKTMFLEKLLLTSITTIIFAIRIIINKNNDMKTSRFIWRIFLVPLVTMLCAFFVAPLQAQGQSVEAYVQMSADKTTLTFFYDTKRATREGTTWGIEEKKEDYGWQYPVWAGTYKNPDTTTTKAVVDTSFKDFRPTSTELWFKNLKALTAIEGLQNLNTSEVTDMSGMFYGCFALTTLDLKNLNTSEVKNMNLMFCDCSSFTSLDISNFNTENVTDMGGMFEDCSALTSLNLKSFNTSNVTSMSGMFYGCSALTSLDFKNFNTSNVIGMRSMFSRCSALTSLDLSNFNTEKVVFMEEMFKGCSKLASIVNNKTWNCKESQGMFNGCTALKGAVAYDENKTDVTMANPNSGYFVAVKPTALLPVFSPARANGI